MFIHTGLHQNTTEPDASPTSHIYTTTHLSSLYIIAFINTLNGSICTQLMLSAVKTGSTFFCLVQNLCMHGVFKPLIANNYTPGSSKGNICALHTQTVTTNTPFPWQWPAHRKKDNCCTQFAAISQNADCTQVNCSNFGTVGKLTIWRTRMCLVTGYSTLGKVNIAKPKIADIQ